MKIRCENSFDCTLDAVTARTAVHAGCFPSWLLHVPLSAFSSVTLQDCTNKGGALQSATRVKPFICTMPMRLDEGWNQIQFNLADFTRRAYGMSSVLYLILHSSMPSCSHCLQAAYRAPPCMPPLPSLCDLEPSS